MSCPEGAGGGAAVAEGKVGCAEGEGEEVTRRPPFNRPAAFVVGSAGWTAAEAEAVADAGTGNATLAGKAGSTVLLAGGSTA